MGLRYNRAEVGLWDGGSVENFDTSTFDNYGLKTKQEGRRTKRFGHVNSNVYGSGAYNGPLIEIDTSEYYQFGASTYTTQLSYNNRTASGHMGIRHYDVNGSTIYTYMSGGTGNTTLTRAASPGDTSIYVADASGWYSGTSTSNNFATFFPASHSLYGTPHYYSRFYTRYNTTTDGTPYTNLGGGEYQVNLQGTLPDWGYSLPVGTPVSNGRGTNANWYGITGNTNHNNLNKWRTFVSSPITGEQAYGGTFRSGTKYVRFLHLRNYTYRAETAGDSARYYIANIFAFKCRGNNAWPTRLFQRGLTGEFY
jgi:hypothetical protein